MSEILDQQIRAFDSDPSNRPAFDALEEHYFMTGKWAMLVALFERRLEAPEFSAAPDGSVEILFRMGQVCEERCLDLERAIESYWRAAKIKPSHRPALRQLRQIYTQRDQWDMVLQIAEMEGELPMEFHEKAAFLAELGNLWNDRLNDPTEAMTHYQDALEMVPDHVVALAGLARVHQGLGHHTQAATVWERLASRLRGPDRAPVLVSLGKILAGHLDQSQRAIECFKRALGDDPRCADAVAALTATATQLEDWPLVAILCERRFDIASGARKRAEIAVDAGRINLEHLDDTQAARMWFDRALELVDEEPSIYDGIAELERRTGDHDSLRAALDRVIELRGELVSTSVLLEAADLYSESGDDQTAVQLLRQAQIGAPENSLVIEALSDGLTRLGLSRELVEILEHRAALMRDDRQAESEIHSEIGRIQLDDLDDPSRGIASLARAFDLDPSTHGVTSKLEVLYREREEWDCLIMLLERASREGPQAKRSHYFTILGELREHQLEDPEAAASAYESALELDPQCLPAHQGVARIVHASGSREGLLRVFEREAEITSDRTRLSELIWKMLPLLEERGRGEDALGWVERLHELCPDDHQALESIVRLREDLGQEEQLQEPLEALDRVLVGREKTNNRRRLAGLHHAAGRHAEAIDWYQSSLEGEPNHVESLQSLKALYSETREFEALSSTMHRLADALPETEAHLEQSELANLLVDQLGDIEGAIVVLWRLAKLPSEHRPDDIDERLEDLLERAGRFEELAQQLLERRRGCDDESTEAHQLDLRRAKLLLDDLAQFEEAVALFGELRGKGLEDDGGILEGLEKALRLGNDADGLVSLLAERAETESDAATRAHLSMERATILEDSLGAFDEAREVLSELASQAEVPQIAEQAGLRLEQILVRCGDWEALRSRLTARLGTGSERDDVALHEEIARLYRDRLGQRENCAEHLEAAGRIAPDRHAIWHNLAVLYAELDRSDDLLRVLEHELTLELDRERETILRSRAARLAAKLPESQHRCSAHYQRLLELEPGDSEATEFLLDFYERENRPSEMLQLLRARLDAMLSREERDSTTTASVISLRLRIAALESEKLDDVASAIETLAPAIEEVGPRTAVARPLADLYLRLKRHDDFVELSLRAADRCELPDERASWLLEVGDVLRRDGEVSRSIEAYRSVLEASPQNLDAQQALRSLYRERGDAAPLAELLVLEVERRADASTLAVRIELATLLTGPLAQPEAALEIFREILEEDSSHPQAFVHAVELTRRLNRHDQTQELLERGLASTDIPAARAALLEQLGNLEAGPLDTPASALGRFREALTLDPNRATIRASLCKTLTRLGRFNELLDCLFLEAQQARPGERSDVFERAISIASREISQDAALPWLERLLSERPQDANILSRIADIHRQAGRPEALLRALEAQMPLRTEAAEQHRLYCSMAEILERDLSSPGRAAMALETARSIESNDAQVLADLDRLYDSLGRHAERAQILEERIAHPETPTRSLATLHHDAAILWQTTLFSPEEATRHLLHSLHLCEPEATEVLPLIRELQQTLRASGRIDGWARAAERELAQLVALRDPANDERRVQLHRELADSCEHQLARPQLALRHLLVLLDAWDGAEPLTAQQSATAEAALIDHLRRERNPVELERRLAAKLDRGAGTSEEWLELAALQSECLHRPSAAALAYRRVLDEEPECLDAIRGLGRMAEILHDWEGVAESLERELELDTASSREERCTLLRRLGAIYWRRLQTEDALERAANAYRSILDYTPDDLESIRALQQLEAERGKYGAAISRLEQEVELLGTAETDRRQHACLKIAELARDKTHDLERAIRAFESAAHCCELSVSRLHEWAELYRADEDWGHFADIFGKWCDTPRSGASSEDLIVLADVLKNLGKDQLALERAEMAIEADRTRATAWERAAALREQRGDLRIAAEQLAEAAELRDGATAARHLLRASQLVSDQNPDLSADLLRRGAEHDAGCQEIQVRLAIVCGRLELWDEAEEIAGCALDLNTDCEDLEPGLLLNAALAGGRGAWHLQALESATRFFAAAHQLDPEDREALDSLGELLFLCGDLRHARSTLEKRLAMPGDNAHQGRQLSIVGEAFALEEKFSQALESFNRAVAAEPTLDQAHEGIVTTHERDQEPRAALRALDRWIEVQADNVRRSTQLLRAANLEQSLDETDSAITRLREATAANPTNASAWTMLARLLHRVDLCGESLTVATCGLAAIDESDRSSVADLCFIRGLMLEQTGGSEERPEDAIDAYGLAVENDPTHSEAILAQARLLRASGEWQRAVDALGNYLDAHPEPTSPILAGIYYERGQLLAGPLERVEEAIRCYEGAVELDPDFSLAIEPLANLLSYMPKRWQAAVRQHRALLAEDPARESSIRSVMRISKLRGNEQAYREGLAILQALGATTHEESEIAPNRLGFALAENPQLPNPHWERLRRMVAQASDDISQALAASAVASKKSGAATVGETRDDDRPDSQRPAERAFWLSLHAAEVELTVPAFDSLATSIIAQTIQQAVALALDSNPPEIESDLGDQLERCIGRWTRRKLRKILEGTNPNDVADVCWDEWRMALQCSAASIALDRIGGDLRSALMALSANPVDAGDDIICESTNISDRVRSMKPARALLVDVTQAWCSRIGPQ